MAIVRWKEGACPGPFRARVQWAFDGDTLLPAGYAASRVVRLYGCDAPEIGQAWYVASRRKLLELVRGKECTFVPRCLDRYGRIVARVEVPGVGDLSRAMIRSGLAWWEKRYAPRAAALREAQEQARDAKLFIWSERYHGFAPWVWRRLKRIT